MTIGILCLPVSAAEQVKPDTAKKIEHSWLSPWLPSWLALSAELSFRTSNPTVVTGLPPPALTCWGPSFKVGVELSSAGSSSLFNEWVPNVIFYSGLGFARTILAQTSDVLPAIGNMTGSRSTLFSPFFRAIYDHDYLGELSLEWNGSYQLSRPTIDGGILSYESPKGVILEAGYHVGRFLKAKGLFAGVVLGLSSFGSETSSVNGTRSASLSLTQVGVVVSYAP